MRGQMKTWLAIGLIVATGMTLPAMAAEPAAFDCSWTATYYPGPNFTGTPFTRYDSVITFDWGAEAPFGGMPNDNFTVRWEKNEYFGSAKYAFAAASDDGVRMYLDGVLIIDSWHSNQMQFTIVEKTLTAGVHKITVEYYEELGRAAIQAGYYPVSSCTNCSPSTACTPNGTPYPTSTTSSAAATAAAGSGGSSSGGSGGSSGGTSGGSSSSNKTPTPIPTLTPTPIGYISAQAQQSLPGSQEGGIILDQADVKAFTWTGFPGPSIGTNGTNGTHGMVKNRNTRATFEAEWVFIMPEAGYYDVFVFIPEGNKATESAYYTVNHAGNESDPIEVDQRKNAGKWVSLGSFYFQANTIQSVSVTNATGETTASTEVLLDAVMLLVSP